VNVLFLTIEQVLAIHQFWINKHGGDSGLRDLGLLQSALAMPRQSFGGAYLHATLPEMAAAYFFHLVSNHAFIDGNKRVGAFSSLMFLDINGHELDADIDTLERLTLSVAEHKTDKADVTAFCTRHVRPR